MTEKEKQVKDVKTEDSDKNESNEEEEGNFYIFYNKGKEYKFDLDELTDEELEKFEKMTEKQRMRFITNFDIRKQNIFPNSISLRGAHENQIDQKEYGKYNLLEQYKNKLREVDNLIKKFMAEQHTRVDVAEKVVIDNLSQSLPEIFQAITLDDIENIKKAYDLNEITLGMIKKYFRNKIENLDMDGSRKSALENFRKNFFKNYHILFTPDGKINEEKLEKEKQQNETKLSEGALSPEEKAEAEYKQKILQMAEGYQNIFNNTSETNIQKIEDYAYDVIEAQQNKLIIIANNSNLEEDTKKKLINSINDTDIPIVVEITNDTSLRNNEKWNKILGTLMDMYDGLVNFTEAVESVKVMKDSDYIIRDSEVLTNPTEEQMSDKLPVIGQDEKRPEVPQPEVPISETKEEPELLTPPEVPKQEEYVPELTEKDDEVINLATKIDTYISNLSPEDKLKNEEIIKKINDEYGIKMNYDGAKMEYVYHWKGYDVVCGMYSNSNTGRGRKVKKIIITHVQQPRYTITAKYYSTGFDKWLKEKGAGYKYTYKYYTKSGSVKIKSGSIISKIRDAFQKKKDSTISSSEPVKELRNEISEIKSELKELKELIKNSHSAPAAPLPLNPISKPAPPQIPTKPQLRHIELNEEKKIDSEDSDPNSLESQLRRTMNKRREDIEYSDDSEEDVDWGAGYSKMSAKDFIAKLKSGRLN